MKYLFINDLDKGEEIDDGIYLVKLRSTEGPDSKEASSDVFTDADIFKIKKKAPEGADAVVFTDDWVFYDSKKKALLGYVFKK